MALFLLVIWQGREEKKKGKLGRKASAIRRRLIPGIVRLLSCPPS
jgi:hypothetical protein